MCGLKSKLAASMADNVLCSDKVSSVYSCRQHSLLNISSFHPKFYVPCGSPISFSITRPVLNHDTKQPDQPGYSSYNLIAMRFTHEDDSAVLGSKMQRLSPEIL